MPLFDTHCHLDDRRFQEDMDEMLERAKEAGVARMVTIGCAKGVEDVRAAVDVAKQIAKAHTAKAHGAEKNAVWVGAAVGVHPHDATCLDDALWAALQATVSEPEVVAVGEAGLDYHYEHSPREVQKEAFRLQIDLAKRTGKPLVIHTREAAEDTLAILREENARDIGGILHCFSEDAAFARAVLDLGFVASFSGIVTFKSARAIQEAARVQPLDALLVETDAPYLAPVPHRGKRNEPAFVAHTAAFIAELRGMDQEALAQATYKNACRVFGLEAVT